MLLLLGLIFIAVPIAEIYVIVQVGQLIGVLPTIALLVIDSIAGALLLRQQGRAAWGRFGDSLRAGRPPARETLDGALVILGGALLLTPGFLSDLLGLVLLLPPTRAAIRAVMSRRLLLRVAGTVGGPYGRGAVWTYGAYGAARRARGHRAARRPYDVDGSAREVEPPGIPSS